MWARKLALVHPTGTVPSLRATHFTCPHCGVDAQQRWEKAGIPPQSRKTDEAVMRSTCVLCGNFGYWIGGQLVWPEPQYGPPASDDLTGELRDLYEEARLVAPRSARAAAALLRLLVEKLATELAPGSKSLDGRIAKLAEDGVITRRMVDALDAVRIGGNNAVHGGLIDPDGGDDEKVALMLFTTVNAIVEATIALPRETREFLGSRRRPDQSDD